MLKRKGVSNVAQLSGGIHRYLERYGKDGFFKGLNFTFDKRVAVKPDMSSQCLSFNTVEELSRDAEETYEVVGKCVECATPFVSMTNRHSSALFPCCDSYHCCPDARSQDELDGGRVCTVCRDLVLVCPKCQSSLREYHCSRHAAWKESYFSFLEVYDLNELQEQLSNLQNLRDSLEPKTSFKNTRRALTRQMDKVRFFYGHARRMRFYGLHTL
jgi:hypothetical protein